MLTSELKEKFLKDGFVLIPNFLTEDEVHILNDECYRIVDDMKPEEHCTVFRADAHEKSAHLGDKYFLTSGDKIRFFFEAEALNDDGSLKYGKHRSLNKIGHALHWLNPEFKNVTFSNKVKNLTKSLDMIKPVIIHSMYIFKPPNIGGEVSPHQDATYLYCEPENKLVGLWIALEDATLDNGCLWFIPGSQTGPVQTRMIRCQEGKNCKLRYTAPQPEYDKSLYVPIPARKGDLILIHGKVVHKSEANRSDIPRPIYTFHIMDANKTEFSKLNWIQPTHEMPFTPLYTEE